MELRHLRYALAVAEERHFTRAAARLGIGQPPLSQQIKLLEQELGVQLFHRLARGVELSDAGKVFMPFARASVAAAEQAVASARRAALGEIGAVSIGFTSSASFNPIVPRLIARFGERHPDLSIRLVEQTTAMLLVAMAEGSVDIAFLRPVTGEAAGLHVRWLPDEDLWLALPARHPLAGEGEVRLGDLADESFILYPRANGGLLYDAIIVACRDAGFSPRIAHEAPQMASTVNLVAAGLGVALVPESMRQLHPRGVAYVRIAGDAPKARLLVAHPRAAAAKPSVRSFMGGIAQAV